MESLRGSQAASTRLWSSGRGEPPGCLRPVSLVEEIGPSELFDLPLQGELGETSANEPSSHRKDFIVSEDSLRGSDGTEVIDEANPDERIKTERPDFGNQIPASKLELAFQRCHISWRSYLRLDRTSRRQWAQCITMEGPTASTAVDELDSRLWPFRCSGLEPFTAQSSP